jgi:hypothetical protein
VQIGDNRAAEWVRRSNPVALGLLFSGLAGHSLFLDPSIFVMLWPNCLIVKMKT